MATEHIDPDFLRKLMADPDFQAKSREALDRVAHEYVDALPDAELTFGPMTRLATDADYLLDELGIRPEGFEAPN